MHTPYDTRLPPHLQALKQEIEGYARGYGLDFYETIFEVIDADDLNEVAAYGGFPTRYPHWSFGMAYEELKKGYDYGLSKIYEMVINNDPCYAYLMRSNHDVDQKLVMAHVYGHCDFFKNNAYFAHTNRKMMDEMANHGARLRSYAEKIGEDEVEAFLDRCMSIDDLIDPHSVAIRRREDSARYDFRPEAEAEGVQATRFKSKDYMDEYVNPPDVLRAEEDRQRRQREQVARSFPEQPVKDVLLFLIENAPLKTWQRDVLSIVRDEAYYFAPQGMTKILNEGWACLVGDSLVATDRGLLRMRDVVAGKRAVRVSDGDAVQPVYDRACFPDRETVRVRTRRGLELEGSRTHQVQLPDGSWRRLDEVRVGDRVRVACGTDLWASEPVRLTWQPELRLTLQQVASAGGCDIETVIRYRRGVRGRHAAVLEPLVAAYDRDRERRGKTRSGRRAVSIPGVVDERLAAVLGYLAGDGHVSARKRTIGLTTDDEDQADRFLALTADLFGVQPAKRLDGGRWRVYFSSEDVKDLLVHLGLPTGPSARIKTIPDVVLQSPRAVIGAFLRAYFDCDGYAGPAGVILSTASTAMSKTVQVVLLNFGVRSTRRRQRDGCWHVHITGQSASRYAKAIGFNLLRKQHALQAYLDGHHWFCQESPDDVIVAIDQGRADVFDVSVADTHRYVADGFVNHNSYWHSTIMTQKALVPSEVIDYADHHSGTMAMSQTRLNPYKLGIELLRDIEMRWNTGRFGPEYEACDDQDRRRRWDRQLGLGRQKIFEVRRIHNDITFIDNFLTPEFCVQHNFFTYAWQEQGGQYYIESRDFAQVKQRLLFGLTNFGKPWIYVVDGNYRNRGELLLKHFHNGIDLRLDQAADTLAHIQGIWGRPVHLTTLIDGKVTTLSFDGSEHTTRSGGESDEPRRNASAKTR